MAVLTTKWFHFHTIQRHRNTMAKILIVDDDVQATTLIDEVLTTFGHQTTVVNESAKAIEVANLVNPDVFVLDLMMPPPDGFKLCRMLRATPNFKQTPILIVTALGDTDSRIVAMGAGANDYLAKPFGIEDLNSKVQQLLDEAK
jgi:two-component system, OmpR family, alkaline phosphatase synthesis response regulator PhoP